DQVHLLLRDKTSIFYLFVSFTTLEYTLFTLFIYLSLREKVFKYILIICSVIFYIIAIFTFKSKQIDSFDSLSASFEGSLIIVYSIFFLYEQINDPAIFYIYHSKQFWIIIAFLLYFSSTLFLFIYAATFTSQEHRNYWNINNIFDNLKTILFTIAFIMKNDKNQGISLGTSYNEL
ncbi:MAG TPA: hypothetical protein VE035_07560, partial [Puia sp.]|nr:hypothetical protein [Puia sp.]